LLGSFNYWVSLFFLLLIKSTMLCVVCGVIYWNKNGEQNARAVEGEADWDEE
jgi:hypothetical protein